MSFGQYETRNTLQISLGPQIAVMLSTLGPPEALHARARFVASSELEIWVSINEVQLLLLEAFDQLDKNGLCCS